MASDDAPYRAPLPVPSDPYAPVWRRYRRTRRLVNLLFAGVLPVCGVLEWRFGDAGILLATPYLILCLVCAFALTGIRCPRCARFLARQGSLFSKHCPHCGIRFGTPKAAATSGFPPAAHP
jgi:hypothetical protein